jgi:hypothetical protein
MNQKLEAAEARTRSRIDALVCGDLAEDERRELLAWLEADAARWRACALAFLEKQVWERALEGEGAGFRVQRSEGEQGLGVRGQEVLTKHAKRWTVPLVVVAASIAAFVCGLLAHELRLGNLPSAPPIARQDSQNPLPAASGPLVASVPVSGLGNLAATLQIPVRPVDSARGSAASSVPDHVRKQWERRGYELVEERRYLPARLPDGRQVMVPVNEVKMKFVGKPVS